MKKLLENFRKFEEQQLLQEDRAALRFPNLDIDQNPEAEIQPIQSERQAEIFARKVAQKFYNTMIEIYETALENVRYVRLLPTRHLQQLAYNNRSLDNTVRRGINRAANYLASSVFERFAQGTADQDNLGITLASPGESFPIRDAPTWGPVGAYIINNVENQYAVKQHEGMHNIFDSIRLEYGGEAALWVLEQLVGILEHEAPGALMHMTRILLYHFGYNDDDALNEELINFTHSILTHRDVRQRFFTHDGTEHETYPVNYNLSTRDMINHLKSAWKRIITFGQELQPEDLPQ